MPIQPEDIIFDYMAPIHQASLSYNKVVRELNALDHFCLYQRVHNGGHLSVLYQGHVMEITREEAEEELEFLRRLRGVTDSAEQSDHPVREAWHKEVRHAREGKENGSI